MLTRLFAYVKGLVRRNAIDAEVSEELRFHVEMETQANVERGMTPTEARRAALRELGGVTQTREAVRGVRLVFLDSFHQDLRFAVRSLRRSPAFALVAIVTLALVIGGSTAIFSALYGLVFRRLPYPDPGRLVMLWDYNLKSGEEHLPMMESAFPIFEREARSFEAMAPYTPPPPPRPGCTRSRSGARRSASRKRVALTNSSRCSVSLRSLAGRSFPPTPFGEARASPF